MKLTRVLAVLASLGCQRDQGQYETRMDYLLRIQDYDELTKNDNDRWIGTARRADVISDMESHIPQERLCSSKIVACSPLKRALEDRPEARVSGDQENGR